MFNREVLQRTIAAGIGWMLALGMISSTAQDAVESQSPQRKVIVTAEGQLSPTKNLVIAAPIAGEIGSITVKDGDRVTEGQRVASLDAEIAEAELVAAEAAFEAAKITSQRDVDRKFAEKSLDVRLRELELSEQANARFQGAVSSTELAKLRLVVDQSRLSIEQADFDQRIAEATADEKGAAVRVAQARLSKHRLLAPCDGLVAQVSVHEGEWIEPGKPVMRLISLHPIRVECFVDGRQFGPDLVGASVEFQLVPETPSANERSSSPMVYEGKVVVVSSELHPVTGQARLWAELSNPDLELRAGMRGRINVLAIE